MKNNILAAVCFLFLFLQAGCKKEVEELTMETKLSSECSYDGRKTVSKFDNEQGVVTYLQEYNMYTIMRGKPSENNPPRLLPCNLPESFRKDKLKVVFSGELKEVYATEYWLGLPFKLTKIKADEN